jgi:para-aminobenzoate synthetase component 1
VFKALNMEPGVFFLDASDGSGWSYIGARPSRTWRGQSLADWAAFRLEAAALPRIGSGKTPFGSGLMGMLSYDLGAMLEGVTLRHPSEWSLFSFGYYPSVLAFAPDRTRVFIGGRQDGCAWQVLNDALSAALDGTPEPRASGPAVQTPVPDFSRDEYCAVLREVLAYIRAGEIYEVNLSRRLTHPCSDVPAVDVYARLRALLPAPYGCCFNDGEVSVMGSSPEMFLDYDGDRIVTRPMKGTRPRGATPRADAEFRRELEDSAKEKAELLMVTDLLRNDLGKVCAAGSVRVNRLRAIEPYRSVFQAVSDIEGRLRPGLNAFDVLEAVFPGGSVTGCPKHRAMQVIDRLERSRRGYYTGALGYIADSGAMKMNMLIRTIFLKDGRAHFSAGGGIVADSDPAQEYEETGLKARGMIEALGAGE